MTCDDAENPHVTPTPATDTSPQIALHPLVLLTISDYVTRHALRKLAGPIVGAIIGQQSGREVTMEVAFECKTTAGPSGSVVLDEEWFQERLEQCKAVVRPLETRIQALTYPVKDVHKAPALDLTGWFTVGHTTGPGIHHVPIQYQLQERFGFDGACLLLFHPDEPTTGGKLPLTVYETITVGDNAMEMNTADHTSSYKFRSLSYTIETGEAEMISVDFVAKGGGNATAVNDKAAKDSPSETDARRKGKGKAKENEKAAANGTTESYLSAEDDELIASLTAKANAVKMLHARIGLLQAYLDTLPPSYVTDASLPIGANGNGELVDHQILRAILALQARIPLLVPPNATAFTRESLEQGSDTALVQLLSSITSGTHEAGEMSRKHLIVDSAKSAARVKFLGGRMSMDAEGGGFDMGVGYGGADVGTPLITD